jgi:hypothetical protein
MRHIETVRHTPGLPDHEVNEGRLNDILDTLPVKMREDMEAVIAAGFKGRIKLGKLEKVARRCAARAKRLATMTMTVDLRKKDEAPGAGNKAAKGAPSNAKQLAKVYDGGLCHYWKTSSGLPPRLKYGRKLVSRRRGYTLPGTKAPQPKRAEASIVLGEASAPAT